jgi:hypothetical protein
MYHEKSATTEYDLACDGKEYPTGGGGSASCQETATSLDETVKRGGKTLITIQRQLDPDGKTYKSIRTSTLPDGRAYVESSTFARVGEGSGFVGTWKRTSLQVNIPRSMVYRVTGDSMHIEVSPTELKWEGKLDGTPAPLTGPGQPAGLVMTRKADTPLQMTAVEILNGKPFEEFVDVLSSDGKTLTRTVTYPGDPDLKDTLVFEKQ